MGKSFEELTVNGHKVSIHYTDLRSYREINRTTRVYVSGTKPDMPMPDFSIKGEDPKLDRAWRKYNRAEVDSMRAVLDEVMGFINDVQPRSLAGSDVKLSFSRKAGCSCLCSPGFKADRSIYYGGQRVADIFIDA